MQIRCRSGFRCRLCYTFRRRSFGRRRNGGVSLGHFLSLGNANCDRWRGRGKNDGLGRLAVGCNGPGRQRRCRRQRPARERWAQEDGGLRPPSPSPAMALQVPVAWGPGPLQLSASSQPGWGRVQGGGSRNGRCGLGSFGANRCCIGDSGWRGFRSHRGRGRLNFWTGQVFTGTRRNSWRGGWHRRASGLRHGNLGLGWRSWGGVLRGDARWMALRDWGCDLRRRCGKRTGRGVGRRWLERRTCRCRRRRGRRNVGRVVIPDNRRCCLSLAAEDSYQVSRGGRYGGSVGLEMRIFCRANGKRSPDCPQSSTCRDALGQDRRPHG